MRPALSILALLISGAKAEMADVQQVSLRMSEAMSRESAALRNYTVLRHYVLTTSTGNHSGEMLVRVEYANPGGKTFDVVWERGSSGIHKRVFRKLLEAEREAAKTDARISPDNYDFHLEGSDVVNGRRCYVLRLEPKGPRKYLIRGRVWVDADDFAIVHFDGEPADTHFWIKRSHVVQRYQKVGRFWLPAVNESETEVRIFGRAHLTIESLEYQVNRHESGGRAETAWRRPVE
jgi:hypothetical protein